MPTNAAVMDIRFGCEPGYPENYAPPAGIHFCDREGATGGVALRILATQ